MVEYSADSDLVQSYNLCSSTEDSIIFVVALPLNCITKMNIKHSEVITECTKSYHFYKFQYERSF